MAAKDGKKIELNKNEALLCTIHEQYGTLVCFEIGNWIIDAQLHGLGDDEIIWALKHGAKIK